MKLSRRTLFALIMSIVSFRSLAAKAERYPSKPVRIMVGYPTGGITDILSRMVGNWLSEHFNQRFITENRPGGATNLATETVVRAVPDGHTLLLIGPPAAINASLYDDLNFVFIRDIAAIIGLISVPNVLVVTPSVPVTTVPALIAYAKANPGMLNMASAGNGSSPHVAGELFKMMTGVNMVHVPYNGGPWAFNDLVAGRVHVMFITLPGAMEFIKSGQLRALAVTSAQRIEGLPALPAIAEFVPGYEASSSYGIGAPRKTPSTIIEALNSEINAGLADVKIKAILGDLGGIVLGGSPEDFQKLLVKETAKWAKVVKFSGAKPY